MFCDLLLKIEINYGCIEPPYECKLLQRYAIPLSSVRNNKLLVYQNGHIFFTSSLLHLIKQTGYFSANYVY